MNLHLKTRDKTSAAVSGLEKVIDLNGRAVYANISEASHCLTLDSDRRIYLFGDIFYHLKPGGSIELIDGKSQAYLEKVFFEQSLAGFISVIEGQYIGLFVDRSTGSLQIFSDRYARIDTFYAVDDQGDYYLATDLDFIFEHLRPAYDQKMLAHLFCVYGWYTPKGVTIYENVKQLRVGEILTLSERGMTSEAIEFKPLAISDYTGADLEVYYQLLRESVVARANRSGQTWVSSSSGWDSSILLALLVDEFGSGNVRMLTGSMKYSPGTDVINKFEMAKIEKISRFFGIKPEVVDFDLRSDSAADYLRQIFPYLKSKHAYFLSLSYSKLSDALFQSSGKSQVIFNGETSDSLHNFGFSQFGTFFHSVKAFTEYGDKMNCYLYGPSFLAKLLDGSHGKDKVFQIFQKMSPGTEFASDFNTREEAIQAFLFPLFYGSPRLPLAKTNANPALTARGQQAIYDFPFGDYMPEVLSSIGPENVYSWLIYLYQSFHAQGSTVNLQKHAMDIHNHKWRMPFHDLRLVDFLSRAPEKWGRGLEINNTKYPLKWVARNKIRFPYEVLDEGPHSYLYDVIEGFSLAEEGIYKSGVVSFYKEKLMSKPYREILGDEYFDLQYLDKLTDDYLSGKEAKGADFTNLLTLITLCSIGWY